jgi:hypothetical protein
MKLTIRKKLSRHAFLGLLPPERHFPPREGRAELHFRSHPQRPTSSLHDWWTSHLRSMRARLAAKTAPSFMP